MAFKIGFGPFRRDSSRRRVLLQQCVVRMYSFYSTRSGGYDQVRFI